MMNLQKQKLTKKIYLNLFFKGVFFTATSFSLVILAILFYRIFSQGWEHLSLDFLTNFASRKPEEAGIKAAIFGTLWIMAITAPVSIILGVGCAIYLEMYAKQNAFTRFIQTNISNLAGVPSIVFGLLGLTVFVRVLEMGRSVLAGGLTMALLILPIIVVAAQEALRSVPRELMEASYGMGASKWQTIQKVVLPAALPSMITGCILALSRAIGETAPLLVIGALSFVAFVPESIWSGFTVLPIQIYNWTSRPQAEFHDIAAAGIIVLLVILFIMNSIAVLIRNKFSKRY